MPERVIRSHPARPEPGLGFSVGRAHGGALSTSPGATTAEPVGPLCSLTTRSHRPLTRLRWPVQAGFPSPAEDDQDAAIDLNELLAPHPEACFLLRVRGCSMVDAGIDDGDLLLVDRALEPSHGRIVIAVVDGEFTVKRLHRQAQVVRLEAAHAQYPAIELKDGQELQVWGVVTRVIKAV
ncbi:translesion error-prone DNA polymerase V autoproteolytic subunit [Lamprobacter modestohalophilus]|uniref:LexA family protein n=1 Tax=Lamprobacter modestohalophilus TaxID=1064514 RepID=UPI002ADEDAB8|nr:translesion error-prone DNA polymerase V autoproteolytic subunit [Lamprobacter modestohalophilus]MEA1051250.1 translesion error-prone DNA polymerase V autoproteolytic subunit [Lamprobacter modestohalophilus]